MTQDLMRSARSGTVDSAVERIVETVGPGERIDYFLSHSWHDDQIKYSGALLLFNGTPGKYGWTRCFLFCPGPSGYPLATHLPTRSPPPSCLVEVDGCTCDYNMAEKKQTQNMPTIKQGLHRPGTRTVFVLPINVMACRRMLVLWATRITRLWCVWELCTFFSFMDRQNALKMIEIVLCR